MFMFTPDVRGGQKRVSDLETRVTDGYKLPSGYQEPNLVALQEQ